MTASAVNNLTESDRDKVNMFNFYNNEIGVVLGNGRLPSRSRRRDCSVSNGQPLWSLLPNHWVSPESTNNYDYIGSLNWTNLTALNPFPY